MDAKEQALAYQQFFYKTEAGKTFMDMLHSLQDRHISQAQETMDLNELGKSAGNKEVINHIKVVIAQVAGQLEE